MLVYIEPHSTFPELHSDTIFGALTYAINELFPEIVEEMISNFENDKPPFLLSSAFPFIKNHEEIIRFYPKPILGNDLSELDMDILKKYKEIKYLDEEIFEDFINGNIDEYEIISNLGDYNQISFLLSKKDIENTVFFGKNIITNNMINRISNKTNVFYSEGNSFKSNSGLYFMITFFDEGYESVIRSSIKFLKDRGFGKDISTGKGHFDYFIEDGDNLYLNKKGSSFISLSRFIPKKEELDIIKENSFYEILSKRARHSSGDLRKQIKFFKEGSTFPNFKELYGMNVSSGVNVKSSEYGYAFPINYGVELK